MAATDDATTSEPTGGSTGRPSSEPTGESRPAATPAPAHDVDATPDPVRATRSDDDRDLGWGDDLDRAGGRGERDARWYEEQRPPHWE